MSVQCHDPPSFKKISPHYASYTTARISPTSTLVTVAGQVGEDPETGELPEEFGAQIDMCLRRVAICLKDASATIPDVTRMIYYIRQGAIDEYEKTRGDGAALHLIGDKVLSWLKGHRPAACYVRSFGMSEDKYMCEFEVMAIVQDASRS